MSGCVYSYLRFSDPRQATGHSADRQNAYAKKWAEDRGLILDESLSLRDEGLSAYHQRHVKSGALGAFLEAVESGRIAPGSVLVVEGLDRLSRAEPIQAQAQLAQIVNAGITVVTASDGKEYSREKLKANPMDLVYSLLVMIRAHEESDVKSKRVKAAIKKLCQDWVDGKYRGLIRNGHDPAWVKLVDGKYELIPERAEAIRMAVQLYTDGYGAEEIFKRVHAAGLRISHGQTEYKANFYKQLTKRVLVGEKELSVDGENFALKGYYPPVITELEWADMRTTAETRGRSKLKGEVPHILTGLGITSCGYCGSQMAGQNNGRKPRLPDGRISDTYRRLRCAHRMYRIDCPGADGSCSSGPVERALLNFCSDMMNLRTLKGGDRSSRPARELAEAIKRKQDLDGQLERLTDAMLAMPAGATVATFVDRARSLEDERHKLKGSITALENELSVAARDNLEGFDEQWRELAAGVEAQDYDARMKARRLVQTTFERLIVYWKGVRPDDSEGGQIDLTMVAKGGGTRMIRIDTKGNWRMGLGAFDIRDSGEAIEPDAYGS